MQEILDNGVHFFLFCVRWHHSGGWKSAVEHLHQRNRKMLQVRAPPCPPTQLVNIQRHVTELTCRDQDMALSPPLLSPCTIGATMTQSSVGGAQMPCGLQQARLPWPQAPWPQAALCCVAGDAYFPCIYDSWLPSIPSQAAEA